LEEQTQVDGYLIHVLFRSVNMGIDYLVQRNLKKRYPQPHNIKVDGDNEALREHRRYKMHRKLKYDASKQSRRLYR
jgi:hypothetical protein